MKIRVDDIIRDFTESDPAMKNFWVIGGKQYVKYRVSGIMHGVVNGVRMASPGHPADSDEKKKFADEDLKRAPQTGGIWENHR